MSRELRKATEEISQAEACDGISRLGVLDLYASSGSLLRASSAFVGALNDYVDQRIQLENGTNGVAEYELISSTDFFARSIDTFVCVVDGLGTQLAARQPNHESAVYFQADGSSVNRLSHAVHFGTPDLDGYLALRDEARRQHDVLQGAVEGLRKVISASFDFKHCFS